MSILLTDTEVSILLHENTFLTDGDFARAIQLALIEKIRKFPETCEYQDRSGNWHGFIDRDHYVNTRKSGAWPIRSLYALPTAQELENER